MLFFILSGLFWLAVSPSFAADDQSNDDTKTAIAAVKMQSAHEFMKENLTASAGRQFQKDFGSSEKDVKIGNTMCGTEPCNLNTSQCLYKEKKNVGTFFRDYYTTLARISSFGILDIDLSSYDYRCVNNQNTEELASLRNDGWDTTPLAKGNTKVKGSISVWGWDIWENDKNCYEGTTSNGQVTQYCAKIINDKVAIYSAQKKQNKCEVVPVRWYNNKQCAFCPMLGVIFAAADQMTLISRQAFVVPFALMIVVGLALWIAVRTLSFVSSLTKQDAAKYITELLRQSYKFLIAFLLLINYDNVFTYIINPLLNTGIKFGSEFVAVESWKDRFGVNTLQEMSKLPADYQRNSGNVYYTVGTYQNMEHLAYNVNKSFALLQTIGQSLICLGWKYMSLQIADDGLHFGLGFNCIIYGLFFAGFGFLLCLAFIFYLLDAVVQLGIVGALLPFLIASWPFKITSKYTSTGFKMLLNSIFTFMMMGIVANLCIELINESFKSGGEGTDGENLSSGGLAALVTALDTIDTESLKEMVNVFSLAFLLFVFANILGFLVVGRITELVDKFASGGMKPVAPSIATMGASTVKGMATKLAAPTVEAVNDWAEEKVETATRWGVNKAVGVATLRPVRQWLKNRKNKGGDKDAKSKPQPDNPQPTGADNPPSPGAGTEVQTEASRPTVIGGGGQGKKSEAHQTGGNNPGPATVGGGQGAEARQNQGQNPEQPGSKPQSGNQQMSYEDRLAQAEKRLAELSQPREGESDLERSFRETSRDQYESHVRMMEGARSQTTSGKGRRPENFVRGGKPTTAGNGRRPDKPKLDELD